MGSMTADNKYDHLILSLSRLGFSKQSGLLGCCKVSYGCQAHLLAIMKDDQGGKNYEGDTDVDEEFPTLPAASGFSAPAGATYREFSLANFSTWTTKRNMT